MSESQPIPTLLSFSVAGINMDGRGDYIRELFSKVASDSSFTVSVTTEPEPDNPYDKDAIRVMINDMRIGYVPKKDLNFVYKTLPAMFSEKMYGTIVDWGYSPNSDGQAVYCIVGMLDPEYL